MKLYEVANFIRKVINGVIVIVLLISAYIYIRPIVSGLLETVTPEEAPPILNKIAKVNFTSERILNFSVSSARINYLGNPETQWQNLPTKKLPAYEYNFTSIEDIDYTPKAKQIALQLGYDDLNQRDNAEISNKYVWTKNGILFEIDKLNKRFVQIPQDPDFAKFKQYLTSGNFVSPESPKPFINRFLETTGRFTPSELNSLELEPQFLRFEENNLVETNNLSAELSYVKVFRKLSGYKVVSKRYEFPQIYFYVSSLRPEIESNFPNYRFIHFKLSKIDYKPSFQGFEYELNPLPVVVNELRQGRFTISDIKLTGTNFGRIPNIQTSNIQSITFDSYELGYYDNFEDSIINEYIQPIYIFKGTVEFNTGERGRITVYTPAIDPKFNF